MFSLEDDECNDLFITQTPYEKLDLTQNDGGETSKSGCLGLASDDFKSPCSSILLSQPQYSDISDDDVMDFETVDSSQIR